MVFPVGASLERENLLPMEQVVSIKRGGGRVVR